MAAIFPNFITDKALIECLGEAREQEVGAFTTDDTHTAHQLPADHFNFPSNSVRNHQMRTQVASIAFDELPPESKIAELYQHPTLRKLVALVVMEKEQEELYLSEDPLGCCSINVFRPGYHHSFHFDESVFSTTLMLQEASMTDTGLFQYTHPLRNDAKDLVLDQVGTTLLSYDDHSKGQRFVEDTTAPAPQLHTLDFKPGTLSIFSGSRSLHRVTKVEGDQSRLTAVLTFSTQPGFRNSPEVQRMFWGRTAATTARP